MSSHLGSAICADCLTRPTYVERSYCDAGRSRDPGSEADMGTGDVYRAAPGTHVVGSCLLQEAHYVRAIPAPGELSWGPSALIYQREGRLVQSAFSTTSISLEVESYLSS